MLKIQDYLLSGKSLDDLAVEYAIKSTTHSRYPELVSLKYNQLNSPRDHPLVRECRGIVLDRTQNWQVVARPFDRFFNHGESLAEDIDWKSARVQEKVDGTLCVVYPYDRLWHVATTGTADASGEVNGFGMTFADLFWQTFQEQGMRLPGFTDTEPSDLCYLFELTTPYNQVVVAHTECRLTLLAIRNRRTGAYLSPEMVTFAADMLACPRVREYPLTSWEAIQATFEAMNPTEQEGYVVVDARGHRVKVKHPGYVALHHLKDSLNPKWFVEVLRQGESTEVLTHFPELATKFAPIAQDYEAAIAEIEADYARIQHIRDPKEFAFATKGTRSPAILFLLHQGKTPSVRQALADTSQQFVLRLLGLKDVPDPVAPERE